MTSGRMRALTCVLHAANERTTEVRCMHDDCVVMRDHARRSDDRDGGDG